MGDISLVNKIHKKIELRKVKRENPKATSSALRVSCIKKRLIVPMKGNKIQVKRRLDPIFRLQPQIIILLSSYINYLTLIVLH